MRIVSDKYTKIGGRLGSMVATMNKSGMNFRTWVVPANPNTNAQQAVRGYLTTLAAAWSGTLTQAQRDAWNAYAATLTFVSKLGTPYTISGFDAYVMGNGARLRAGLTRVDAGPVVAGFDSFTPVVGTWDDSSHTLSVAYTNSDPWAGEVGGALSIRRCSLPFEAGVTFYEGPFIYADKVAGAGTPPTSPKVITLDVGFVIAGMQYAMAVRSVRADGRCSREVIFRSIGVT